MSDKLQPESAASFEELQHTIELAERYAQDDNINAANLHSHIRAIEEDLDILLNCKASDVELQKCSITLERTARRVRRDLERLVNDLTEKEAEINTRNSTQQVASTAPSQKPVADTEPSVPMKLPMCKMPVFSGDPSKFLTFYDTYCQLVLNNPAVPLSAKWVYLYESLEGNPLTLIKKLPQRTGLNVALQMLRQTYENSDKIVSDTYFGLQFLPPADNKEESLRLTHAQLEGLLLTLEELNHDTENNPFIRQLYIGKFPTEMIANIVQPDQPLSQIRIKFNAHILAQENAIKQAISQTYLKKLCDVMIADAQKTGQASTLTENFVHQVAIPAQNTTVKAPSITQSAKNTSLTNKSPTKRTSKMPQQCLFCTEKHWLDQCGKVSTASERIKLIPDRCTRCIRPLHPGLACALTRRCTYCSSTEHNRALCPKQFPDKTASLLLKVDESKHEPNGTFWTMLVQVSAAATSFGIELRIMLDPGSTRSLITASAARKLRLPISTKKATNVVSADDTEIGTLAAAESTVTLSTPFGAVEDICVFIIPKIIDDVPAANVERFREQHGQYDDIYILETGHGQPVDLLLGNDCLVSLLELEKSITINEQKQLLATKLGWILIEKQVSGPETQSSLFSLVTDDHIKKMWDLESIGLKYAHDSEIKDEEEAIKAFYKNIVYKDRRYEVTWPWRMTPPAINENFGQSLGRLRSLWKQLNNKPHLLQEYDRIIQQQIQDRVVEEVQDEGRPALVRYIPHHPVFCPEKSTKIRLVYDASAKGTKNDRSLNECLLKGKKWLDDLPAMILRFRQSGIAIAADIEKAYHQIGIAPADRDVVRFLWLHNIKLPPTASNLRTLRFRRVAFGIVSSPFLLYATLTYHLQKQNSEVARLVMANMYADNLVISLPSHIDPTQFYTQTKTIFATMSMNLTKWATNDRTFQQFMPIGDRNDDEEQGLLGMKWHRGNDTLSIKQPREIPRMNGITKRVVLSRLASVFDPLGWAAPITLLTKIYIRGLWARPSKWDQQLEADQKREWNVIENELQKITRVQLPRQMFHHDRNTEKIRLHAFSDASATAVAVVVYAEKISVNSPQIAFVTAKTKLTPKSELSIPRLELLAAVLASRFVTYLRSALRDSQHTPAILWSDSRCVLAWITSSKMKPNVIEKQTNEIKSQNIEQYLYVPSEMNPADVASRGATYEQLSQIDWWSNPKWLLCNHAWPTQPSTSEEICTHENTLLLLTQPPPERTKNMSKYHLGVLGIDEKRFSSLTKLLRITGYCLKALNSIMRRQVIPIEHDNIRIAKRLWIRMDQIRFYTSYNDLQHNKTKIINNMRAFRDLDGVVRVHTRIQNAAVAEDTVAPILLINGTHLTKLIIIHVHNENKHVGVSHTLALLRKQYILPRGRREVSSVIRSSCFVCRRYLAKTCTNPPPAPLPEFRVRRGTRPFAGTGMDILGPFTVRASRSPDATRLKRWVIIFTCTTIRAVHLEVLHNMTTVDIVDALRRFVARRGAPEVIVCDNAPQFHALEGRFSNLWREIRNRNEFNDYLTRREIMFKFVPQDSPWMGGVYERLIRDVKVAMERTYGLAALTDQQFATSICEVEAVINERPLTYVTNENDNNILTPNHFLAARFTAIELEQSKKANEDPIAQLWRTARAHLTTFWSLWSSHYLLSLRDRDDKLRQRRLSTKQQFEVGEIVLIAESDKHRSSWRLAKIISLIKSDDGVVRSVLLQLASGTKIIRPVIKVAPIGLQSDETGQPPVELSKNRRNLVHAPPEGASETNKDADEREHDIITVFPNDVVNDEN